MAKLSPLKIVTIVPDETWDIVMLIEAFQTLAQKLSPEERASVEEKKLCIIQAVENKIKKEITLQCIQTRPNEKKSESTLKQSVRQFFYYFFVIFGLFEEASGSYLYSKVLFSLIPGMTKSLLMMTGIAYTLLDCTIFYVYEVAVLKKALGIAYSKTGLSSLIEIYSNQLKSARIINQLLSTIPMLAIDNELYENYIKMTQLLNQDLQIKHNGIASYYETVTKKILKLVVIAFGLLSSTSASYFFATSTIAIWAPALMGNPLGWALICLTGIGNLGFYYAMGGSSMIRIVNPDYDKYQDLKKELRSFKEDYHDSLSHTALIKHCFEKKKTEDAGTQTDPIDSPFHQSGLTFFTPARAEKGEALSPQSVCQLPAQ